MHDKQGSTIVLMIYHAWSDVRRCLEHNPGDRLVAWRCAEWALICPVLVHVFYASTIHRRHFTEALPFNLFSLCMVECSYSGAVLSKFNPFWERHRARLSRTSREVLIVCNRIKSLREEHFWMSCKRSATCWRGSSVAQPSYSSYAILRHSGLCI